MHITLKHPTGDHRYREPHHMYIDSHIQHTHIYLNKQIYSRYTPHLHKHNHTDDTSYVYIDTAICRIHFTPTQTTIHFINTYEERKAQEDKFGVKVGRMGKRNRKQRSKVTNRNR